MQKFMVKMVCSDSDFFYSVESAFQDFILWKCLSLHLLLKCLLVILFNCSQSATILISLWVLQYIKWLKCSILAAILIFVPLDSFPVCQKNKITMDFNPPFFCIKWLVSFGCMLQLWSAVLPEETSKYITHVTGFLRFWMLKLLFCVNHMKLSGSSVCLLSYMLVTCEFSYSCRLLSFMFDHGI